jgi:hypothetical protein
LVSALRPQLSGPTTIIGSCIGAEQLDTTR